MNNFEIDYCKNKFWYKERKCHREDGPAAEFANGDKLWYKNGLLHREDAPAIEDANGDKYWCINNIFIYEHISKNNILDKIYEKIFNKIFIDYKKEDIIYLRDKFNIINIKSFVK